MARQPENERRAGENGSFLWGLPLVGPLVDTSGRRTGLVAAVGDQLWHVERGCRHMVLGVAPVLVRQVAGKLLSCLRLAWRESLRSAQWEPRGGASTALAAVVVHRGWLTDRRGQRLRPLGVLQPHALGWLESRKLG